MADKKKHLSATLFGYEVPGWPPGTRHYFTDDGKVFAVTVHVDPEPNSRTASAIDETLGFMDHNSSHTVAKMPTNVIECRPDGLIDNEAVEPVHVCEPDTSHADALHEHGYIAREE